MPPKALDVDMPEAFGAEMIDISSMTTISMKLAVKNMIVIKFLAVDN